MARSRLLPQLDSSIRLPYLIGALQLCNNAPPTRVLTRQHASETQQKDGLRGGR